VSVWPGRRIQRASRSALSRCDEREDPLRERPLAARVVHDRLPARLDVLRHLLERELAQGRQVLLAEEGQERALDLVAGVDLPRLEPELELLGCDVHEHHLVRLVEHPVGKGLAHPHARQLEHQVVQALEVLDVHRRDDVDAGVEDLLDVLVALAVRRARGVRVGKLVDEGELRRAAHDPLDVDLLEPDAPVLDDPARHDLEPLGQDGRLRPVVRLEVADHDVDPVRPRLLPLEEHPVRLPDAGRGTQQDPIATAHARNPRAS
jgi:hypothetical protein